MQNKQKETHFTTISVIVILLALIVTAVLKALTPKSEVIIGNEFVINNYDNSQTTYKKVNYSGTELVPPETFNIYQATNNNNIAQDLADRIIISNDLLKDKNIENYWLGENSSLIKNKYENTFTFKVATVTSGDKNLRIVTNEAISICQDFYNKYNININLIPQENDIYYLNSGFEQNVVDQSKATFIQIPLTYELDGYKVFYENQNNYPFFCRVDNSYNLERVVFKDFFQDFSLSRKIKSISLDKAVDNLKKGNASIIDANSKITSILDLNWINEADLYSATIEYRYDNELKIVYPFYRFQAKLTNSAGINIEAEIITPAVNTAIEK